MDLTGEACLISCLLSGTFLVLTEVSSGGRLEGVISPVSGAFWELFLGVIGEICKNIIESNHNCLIKEKTIKSQLEISKRHYSGFNM